MLTPYLPSLHTSVKITLKQKKKNKQKITNHLTSDTANIQINALSIRAKVHLTGTREIL